MSTPIHALLTGTFTSTATVVPISLPSGYDVFELVNITDIGDAGATTQVMRAKGYSSLPAGSAYLNLKTNGAATLAIESMITTGGFTWVDDSGALPAGAAVVVTAITNANPAVVSSASTAVVGDIVRVYGTTGMFQVAGMDFTVTAVNPGVTQSLGYLNGAGFLAAATAGFIRVMPFDPRFYPRRRYITGITQAANAVVTLSVTHGYLPGEKVRMDVPAAFGMTKMNGLLPTILSVNTGTNTITLDVDSTAFTAFAYPTSAIAAIGVTPAQVIPVGQAVEAPWGQFFFDGTQNQSFKGILVGTGVQTTGKLYQWIARRGVSV